MSTNLSAPITATNESSNKRPRDEDSGVTAAGPEAEGDDGEGDAWTWDDLKELYERAMTSYTAGDDPASSVALCRGLINECDRIVRNSPDQTRPLQQPASSATSAVTPEGGEKESKGEPVSTLAFFHIYATSLSTLSKLFHLSPTLRDPAEPSPFDFALAAIDLYSEASQSISSSSSSTPSSSSATKKGNAAAPKGLGASRKSKKTKVEPAAAAEKEGDVKQEGGRRMEWKLELAWGRTLVQMAALKLDELESMDAKATSSTAAAAAAAGEEADLSLLSPTQLLLLASDHFDKGLALLASAPASSSPTFTSADSTPPPPSIDPVLSLHPSHSLPALSNSSLLSQIRLSLPSLLSPLIDRLPTPSDRLLWAKRTDALFAAVPAGSDDKETKAEIARGRGGLWLAVGGRLVEGVEEEFFPNGDDDDEEAEIDFEHELVVQAREVMKRALGFLGEAREEIPREQPQPAAAADERKDGGEEEKDPLGSMIVEACVTLMGLMPEEGVDEEREELEGIAREEGWEGDDEEEVDE